MYVIFIVVGRGSETQLQVDKKIFFIIQHFNPFNAGIVFIRQNLTSVYVRFWRIKTIPALKELTFL